MATRLISILRFTTVAAGASMVEGNLLNINERPILPDIVALDNSGFSVVCTLNTVTVTNNGSLPASVDVLLIRWHTILRVFGPAAVTDLVPQPFSIAAPAAPAAMFGGDYQVVQQFNRTTTTGAGFVTKVTLTTPALTGTYRVFGRAIVDSVSTMQIRLLNITDGGQLGGTAEYSLLNSGDRVTWLASENVVFTGALKTFEIQFRDNPPPGNRAGCSEAVLELWRVI